MSDLQQHIFAPGQPVIWYNPKNPRTGIVVETKQGLKVETNIKGKKQLWTLIYDGNPLWVATSSGAPDVTAPVKEERPSFTEGYFTLPKAKKLVSISSFKNYSDDELQNIIVQLRDYARYTGDTALYKDILVKGGYFNQVIDSYSSGLTPKDAFLHVNLESTLNEAIKERDSRQAEPVKDESDDLLAGVEKDIPLDLARRAHYGTSFDPDKRGERAVQEYVETIKSAYEQLSAKAKENWQKDILKSEFPRYRQKLKELYKDALHSHSNIVSTMIAGPSNFPARRMEKRNRWYENKINEYLKYKTEAFNRISRKMIPDEYKPVSSDNQDALSLLKKKLQKLEARHEEMKKINALIRKNEDEGLRAMGISQAQIAELKKPDFMGRVGIPSFSLTNNSAEIRRIKGRIIELERKAQDVSSEQTVGDIKIIDNVEENRVQIVFPGKPSEAIRTKLKKAGFHWSPYLKVWQRMRGLGVLRLAAEIAKEADPIGAKSSETSAPVEPKEMKLTFSPFGGWADDIKPGILLGETDTIKSPTRNYEIQYALIPLEQVITSHDPWTFAKSAEYPAQCQERNYHNDKSEQFKVLKNTKAFDARFVVSQSPTATDGPPVVIYDNDRALVIGGNSRAMTIKRFCKDHGDLYYQYVQRNLDLFGITGDATGKMLVRIITNADSKTVDNCSRVSRDLNETFVQAKDQNTEAASIAKSITQSTLDLLSGLLERYDSLAEFYGSNDARAFIKELRNDGIITANNANKYLLPNGMFTDDAKDLITKMLVAQIVTDKDHLAMMSKTLLSKIAYIIPQLISLKYTDWDVTGQIQKVVELDIAKVGAEVNAFLSQTSMFDKIRLTKCEYTFALAFQDYGVRKLKEKFIVFLEAARSNQGEQLFDKVTKPEAIEKIFKPELKSKFKHENPLWDDYLVQYAADYLKYHPRPAGAKPHGIDTKIWDLAENMSKATKKVKNPLSPLSLVRAARVIKNPTDKDRNMEIATEILRQLGGNKFRAMTGANHFMADERALVFKIPFRFKKSGINYVKIILRSDDLYDVIFMNYRGLDVKIIAKHEGVYADMLQSIFTKETGLDTYIGEVKYAGRKVGNPQYKLSLIKYPTGKYGYVGSIPPELTIKTRNKAGQIIYQSLFFTDQQAALDYAKKYGYDIKISNPSGTVSDLMKKAVEKWGGKIIGEIENGFKFVLTNKASRFEIEKDQVFYIELRGGDLVSVWTRSMRNEWPLSEFEKLFKERKLNNPFEQKTTVSIPYEKGLALLAKPTVIKIGRDTIELRGHSLFATADGHWLIIMPSGSMKRGSANVSGDAKKLYEQFRQYEIDGAGMLNIPFEKGMKLIGEIVAIEYDSDKMIYKTDKRTGIPKMRTYVHKFDDRPNIFKLNAADGWVIGRMSKPVTHRGIEA